jgi:hypothetical protein
MWHLLASALLSSQVTAGAAQCGATIISQSFDKYPGDYQTWSREADFPAGGVARPSAGGTIRQPGLTEGGHGFENVQVGKGQMQMKFPKGMTSVLAICRWSVALMKSCCHTMDNASMFIGSAESAV